MHKPQEKRLDIFFVGKSGFICLPVVNRIVSVCVGFFAIVCDYGSLDGVAV